ncbi:MAG: molybdopterin dinucleotide binding domain-containing protein, partial [Halapricum sp.]
LSEEDYRGNYLYLNPEDAEQRDIETGDMVRIESKTGSGELMAVVTQRARPGFVTAEYGFGQTSAITTGEDERENPADGMNTMMLHDMQMDPITGQVDRHIAVDVAPAGGD